ncbi:stage II sporulation protein P [Caproiciproducens sp. NJN-50]|uniref:stage II sporulation protein P n=1 Tax=Acutalibacteraceae TaxID=3082771 RepID=UPI000FFDFE7A|nr:MULTISPECIES: stage II sporulation protein P [Acutalibacteraceae]QAT51106.1 stage II sporulation protein P [Caproiciproducens sp. NJN-50]
MKKGTERLMGMVSALLAVLAVACVAVRLPEGISRNTAVAAAGFILPYGAAEEYKSADETDDTTGSSAAPSSEESASPSSSQKASSSKAPSSAASTGTGSVASGVEEMCINTGGSKYENFYVKNSNQHHTIDIGAELKKQPDVKIQKNASPQVLIYHTHTTEAFDGVTRTTDKTKSVCAVGDEITKQLQAAGIGVIHDTTYHDYPAYNGSYNRSIVTMQKDLKQYPSIQVTIDLHRDAMTRSDGTRLKPTAVVNGKKAAQVMIISGCDDTGDLGFPDWEYNLRLALRLQKSMADLYPDLGRPLNFCARRYNENVTHGSLLVEIGTDANTLEEAVYGGELFGKALAAALSQLT